MHRDGLVGRAWGVAAGALAGAAVAAAVFLTGAQADAKTSYESPYGFDRTWNASLRLVRVDLGLKVTEKDDTTGYLLFDYKSQEAGSKTSSGSIELVRSQDPTTPVHVIVQLPQMPRYHEQVLLDELVQKMKQDYGEPPAPRARPKVVADAGAPEAGE